MSKKTYEISLVSLTQDGILCKNIDVTWEKPSCINIKCEYNTVTKTLKITVPDDCVGECIYVKVECKDNTCTDCPQFEYLKVCPCTVPSDCDDCETCEGNMCVSVCDEGEFCSNDLCVECDTEHPCPCNQVCVKGKCTCPPGTQEDAKGCCKTCLTTEDDCPPCTICTPNGCEPVDCVIGVCDPVVDECVECLKRVDCKKEHECCVDKKCECCDGFVRNLVTGECEPEGCYEDKDCEECEICDGDICIPMDCGPGYTCVKDQCEPICDCDETLCSKTEACVNLDSETCYCKECEGDCDTNLECGEGCYCAGNGKCEPKPCKGKCTNGTECGPGCGCDENGDCVPCDSLDCNTSECKDVLGCTCTGAGCKDETGCNGECGSYHDCGPGCTCVGGFCKPCVDFSCDNNDCVNQPGCECQNDGLCGGDPDRECADIFTVTKIDESCDLEASLIKQEACACSPLTLVSELVSVSYTEGNPYKLNFNVSLRKGTGLSLSQSKTLPKLGDTNNENIADNEKPTSGTIMATVQYFYDEYDNNGKKIRSNVPGTISNKIASIGNKDTVSFELIIIEPGLFKSNESLVIVKAEVVILQNTDLIFPNGCNYKSVKTINTFVITDKNKYVLNQIIEGSILLKSDFENYFVISSLDKRYPLFTVYRSTDGSYDPSDIISKIYIPNSSLNQYIYTLYGPVEIPSGKYPLTPDEGGLRSGKYYAFKNDCSCDPYEDLGKLVFCNPTELFYEAKDCNTKVKLLKPFEPCSVNQDLKKFGINDPNSQVKYDFYLNTTKVATFVDSQYGMVVDGLNTTMFTTYDLGGELIETISLKINHDTNHLCDITIGLSAPQSGDVNYLVDCNTTGKFYKVRIPSTGIFKIEITEGEGTVEKLGLEFILTLAKNQDIKALITYDNHCTNTLSLHEDCCEDFRENGFTVSQTSQPRDSFLDLFLSISQGYGPYYIEYVLPNNTILGYNTNTNTGGVTTTSKLSNNPFNTSFSAYPSHVTKANNIGLSLTQYEYGAYSVSVVDSAGCLKTIILNVTKIEAPTLIINGYEDICQGNSTQIVITGDITTASGVVTYTENGVSKTLTLSLNGGYTITPITTSKTFVFDTLTVGGVTYTIGQTVNITVNPIPNATLSAASNTICKNDSIILNINGTAGATVTITGGLVVTLNGNGQGSITVTPLVTTTYYITNITLYDCSGTPNSHLTITVNEAEEILIVSNDCTNMTTRVIVFNHISDAHDQLGNTVPITNNTTVTIDPTTVTTLYLEYNAGTCVRLLTLQIEACSCPPMNYRIDNNGVICEGVTYFAEPFNIVFSQAGNDLTFRSNNGTYDDPLYYQNNVGAGLFALGNISTPLTQNEYMILRVANHDYPQCVTEISIPVDIVHMTEPQITIPIGNICTNNDLTFSTTNDGNSYFEWTAVCTDTSLDYTPVGNTSHIFILNTPDDGNYEITLKVTSIDTGCEISTTSLITIEDCCGFSATLSQGNNCMPIVATPINITAPYQLKWYIDGVLSANQGLSYPAADLPAGTGEAYVELIKNGCTYASNVFIWEKCNCNCVGTVCQQVMNINNGNGGYGTIIETDVLSQGTELKFNLNNDGIPDRFRVYEGAVLILDTGYVGAASGPNSWSCPTTNGYPMFNAGALPAGTDIAPLLPVGTYVKPGIALINVLGGIFLEFEYTLTTDAKVKIVHNDSTCVLQGTWSASLTCL